MSSDGTSKTGGLYLHGTHGERILPEFNTMRSSISSPGENLGNKIKRPTKICTSYTQGRCDKGNSCMFLHEIEGPGSDYRWDNSRGSEEGSQVRSLSNLKVPQFKDSDGLTKDKLYGSHIHAHGADKQSTLNARVPQGMSSGFDTLTKGLTPPINELVPYPVVYEKNQEPFLGRHSDLTAETYLNGRGTFPRLPDGGILQPAADKGTYSGVNYSYSKLQYQSFGLSIPSDPLQCNENLSAYGGTAWNLSNTHHQGHLSSGALYNTYSLPGSRDPLYATSDHSFGSSTLRTTSHLGRMSQHLPSSVIENIGPHKYVDAGTGTSRPALCGSTSPRPSIVSPGSLSPIKLESWDTSVPFVPSFDFPDLKTPPRSQYDPFIDYVDSPKDDNKKNLKSSGQNTKPCVVTPKSLNHDGKLARNISAKGSNELACLIGSDGGRSSSLDDNNRVKVDDRKPNAASNNEKTRILRFRLADLVKELIEPVWKEGYLSKEAYKLVVKKSIDKVLSSIEPHQVPTSEDAVINYIVVNKSKIERLVKAYIDMHRKE